MEVILLYAQRRIDPLEEITYDYRLDREQPKDREPCRCGAPKCRLFLN